MDEIARVPWNGLRVASTFSGCGGSSLGYRMAGFKVVWANEFIPEAVKTYKANHPDTFMNAQSIRTISPDQLLKEARVKHGELDLLDGSPPCASFSLSGKTDKHWGKAKKYSDTFQRVDDLFFEFTRILRGVSPRAFIAENVASLSYGKAKGVYLEVLETMKGCGYVVGSVIIDAQWCGVPQTRARLIFIGFRNDLGITPTFPKPLTHRFTLADALANVPTGSVVEKETWIEKYSIGRRWDALRQGQQDKKRFNLCRCSMNLPCPAVLQTGGCPGSASITHPTEKRKFSIAELRSICGFPHDFKLTGKYRQQYERLGRAVAPPMMKMVSSHVAGVLG